MTKRLTGFLVLVLIGCSGGGGGGTGGGSGSTAGGSGSTAGGSGSTAGGSGSTAGGSGTGGGSSTAGGTATAGGMEMPVPTELIGLSAGFYNTCAVLANKTAKCWGRNSSGQLGNGTTDNIDTYRAPVQVMGLTTVEQISVGYEHVCAVLTDRTGRCWGNNGNGQLGNNTKMSSSTPVTVMGLSNVASIHAGVSISCAVHMDGTVSCWGRGGDLGDNGVMESLVPRVVPGLANVAQLSVAPNGGTSSPIHVCGRRTNGTAFCWGTGAAGALGSGDQNSARAPVPVVGPGDAGITDAVEITAGGSHGCMRRAAGVSCWGFSSYVGDGTVNQSLVAIPIDGGTTLAAVEAGNDFTLARTAGNNLMCWGRNGRGQCGDGAMFTAGGPNYLAPSPSSTMNVSLFSSGGQHACAYQPGPRVTWCWGSSDWGELGWDPGQFVRRSSVPGFVRW